MSNSLQGALLKMGSNFLVAAFVPAMAFIIASAFVFRPIIPIAAIKLGGTIAQVIQASLVLLVFTTILGFTLYTLGTYIYKAFEGYTFLLGKQSSLRNLFLRRQARRFKKVSNNKSRVEKKLRKIEKRIQLEKADLSAFGKWRNRRLNRYHERQVSLTNQRYSLIAELELDFPPSPDVIMPTRFGNILRAAEMYPGRRYKIDAVQLWPRMAHTMPDAGMEKVNEANNQCQFLLNAALLASVLSFLCLLASVYQGIMYWGKINDVSDLLYFIPVDLPPFIYQQRIWIYFFLAILAIAVARFFYEASLFNVIQFGYMIRSSYDLYRFSLLQGLHLDLPATLNSEKRIWAKLSHFMSGNLEYEEKELEEVWREDPIDFLFRHPQDKNKPDSKTEDANSE